MSNLLVTTIGLAAALAIGGVMLVRMVDPAQRGAPPDRAAQSADAPPAAPRPPARPPAETARPLTPRAPAPSFGTVTIEQGRGGHFVVDAEVHGRRIPMLVDTGASVIALTAEDARAAGLYLLPSDFTGRVSTANGVTSAAPVTLREVRIRSITVSNVPAMVMQPGVMEQSLLGMSFLGRLGGYEVAQGRLVLRP